MSPLTNIIAIAVGSGLISSVLGFVSLLVIGHIFFSHFGIIFGGGSHYSGPEKIISIICLVCLLLSIALCPFLAVYMSPTIFGLTGNFLLRFLLFAMIGTAQVSFLTVEYFTVYPSVVKAYKKLTTPPTQAEVNHQKEKEVTDKVNAANIDVTVKSAKILHDDGKNLTAEFILQIKNVPSVVAAYSVEVRTVNGEKGFVVGTRNFFRGELVKFLSLKAVNENDRWIFFGQRSDEIVSDNSDEVPFRVNFFRTGEESRELPQTVTPYLRTILYDGKKAFAQIELFQRPVPVNFENPLASS